MLWRGIWWGVFLSHTTEFLSKRIMKYANQKNENNEGERILGTLPRVQSPLPHVVDTGEYIKFQSLFSWMLL